MEMLALPASSQNGKKPGPLKRPKLPNMHRTIDLDSTEHDKMVDWCNAHIDYAARAKQTVEKEGLEATRHYCAFLDPDRHPWPVKVYDPILLGSIQGHTAKALEAIFAQPPIFDYMPYGPSTFEDALAMQAVVSLQLDEIRPRMTIHDGYQGQELVGTQVWHDFWDYQERICCYWQRIPREAIIMDPLTGEPTPTYVEDGRWKWVRRRKVVRDCFNFKPIHITQLFLDDTDQDIQNATFIGVRNVLTADEARERVESDSWDSAAVERALQGSWQRGTYSSKIADTIDWLKSIGLHVGSQSSGILDSPRYGGDRAAVECFEMWYRQGLEIRRRILLNRQWIGKDAPSPYGTGRYPFRVSRCFGLQGQFWGLSAYRVNKWIIRAIQTLRNAGVSEAVLAAMPPMLLATGVKILGKRWEPRAEWTIQGAAKNLRESLMFLEKSGQSVAVANQQADNLIARFDTGAGSNDMTRGAPTPASIAQKATTMSLAATGGGLRDKLKVDNFGETLMELAQDAADYTQQYQDWDIQRQLRPRSEPLTITRDYLRSICVRAKETISSAGLRELREKRIEKLYTSAAGNGEPYADREALWRLYAGAVAPEEVDSLVRSKDQVMAEQMAAQGMPPASGGVQLDPNAQVGTGEGDLVDEMAAEVREAFATQ